MTELETIVRDQLDLFVEEPRRAADWGDVLRRVRARRRRSLAAVLGSA